MLRKHNLHASSAKENILVPRHLNNRLFCSQESGLPLKAIPTSADQKVEQDPAHLKLITQHQFVIEQQHEQECRRYREEVLSLKARVRELEDLQTKNQSLKIALEEETTHLNNKLKMFQEKCNVLQVNYDQLLQQKVKWEHSQPVHQFIDSSQEQDTKKSLTDIFSSIQFSSHNSDNNNSNEILTLQNKVAELTAQLQTADKALNSAQDSKQQFSQMLESQLQSLREQWHKDTADLQKTRKLLVSHQHQYREYVNESTTKMQILNNELGLKQIKMKDVQVELQTTIALNNQLKGQVTRLSQRNCEMADRLNATASQISALQEEVKGLTAKLDKQQEESTDLKKQLLKMREEQLPMLQSKLQAAKQVKDQKIELLQSQIKAAQQLNSENMELIHTLQQSCDNWQAKHIQQMKTYNQLQNKRDQIDKLLQIEASKSMQLQKLVSTYQLKLKQQELEFDDCRSREDDLQRQVRQLEESTLSSMQKNIDNQTEIQALHLSMSKWKQYHEETMKEYEQYNYDNKRLRKVNLDLQADLHNMERTFKDRLQQMQTRENETARNLKQRFQNQLAMAQEQNTQLRHQNGLLEAQISQYSFTIRQLKDRHKNQLQQLQEEHGNQLEQLQEAQGNQLQQLRDAHGNQLQSLKDMHGNQLQQLQEAHGNQLQQLHKHYREQCLQLEESLASVSSQQVQSLGRLKRLETSSKKSQSEIDRLHKQLQKLQQQNCSLKSELKNKQKSNTRLQSQKQALEFQLQSKCREESHRNNCQIMRLNSLINNKNQELENLLQHVNNVENSNKQAIKTNRTLMQDNRAKQQLLDNQHISYQNKQAEIHVLLKKICNLEQSKIDDQQLNEGIRKQYNEKLIRIQAINQHLEQELNQQQILSGEVQVKIMQLHQKSNSIVELCNRFNQIRELDFEYRILQDSGLSCQVSILPLLDRLLEKQTKQSTLLSLLHEKISTQVSKQSFEATDRHTKDILVRQLRSRSEEKKQDSNEMVQLKSNYGIVYAKYIKYKQAFLACRQRIEKYRIESIKNFEHQKFTSQVLTKCEELVQRRGLSREFQSQGAHGQISEEFKLYGDRCNEEKQRVSRLNLEFNTAPFDAFTARTRDNKADSRLKANRNSSQSVHELMRKQTRAPKLL